MYTIEYSTGIGIEGWCNCNDAYDGAVKGLMMEGRREEGGGRREEGGGRREERGRREGGGREEVTLWQRSQQSCYRFH